jgi:GGDEF domain-containing protein
MVAAFLGSLAVAAILATGEILTHGLELWLHVALITPFALLCGWLTSGLIRSTLHLAEAYNADSARISRALSPIGRRSIYDPGNGLFANWYFRLRLDEEIDRSRRYNINLSIVSLRLARPARRSKDADDESHIGAPDTWDTGSVELAKAVTNVARSVDFIGTGGDREYIFCLPHTDDEGAEVLANRLTSEFADHIPFVGVACFPGDGDDAETLLDKALLGQRAIVPSRTMAAPRPDVPEPAQAKEAVSSGEVEVPGEDEAYADSVEVQADANGASQPTTIKRKRKRAGTAKPRRAA